MLYRFPKSFLHNPQVTLANVGKSVLAYFKLVDKAEKNEGFLTENTLAFVFKGSKCIHLSDNNAEQTMEARAGDLLLLKRGVYFMSAYLLEEDRFQAMVLCLDDNFIKSFISKYELVNTIEAIPAYAPRVIHCADPVLEVRNSILHYMQYPHENTARLLELKLEELFLLLITGKERQQVMIYLQQLFDKSANSIELILKNNLFKPFTLQEYAKMCGLSLSTFKRAFSKMYNDSPKEWINRERLSHAHFLLSNGSKNVSEVALECGFDNVSYFIKLYKLHYGLTPKNAQRPKIASF